MFIKFRSNLNTARETERKKILFFKRELLFWRVNEQDLERVFIILIH
jgi:hypothetical protein